MSTSAPTTGPKPASPHNPAVNPASRPESASHTDADTDDDPTGASAGEVPADSEVPANAQAESVSGAPSGAATNATPPVVAVDDVHLRNDDTTILDGVSLALSEGESLALLGPNGAGKSSLIDVLLGHLDPDAGTARIWGWPFDVVRERVGTQLESTPMFHYARVSEMLNYACVAQDASYDRARHLLQRLDIEEVEDRLVRVLSQGQRKQVGIVLALLHDPDLLILDEPTSGLDPFVREQLWDLIQERPRTVFFTTHIWSEAERFADTVAFLADGHVLAQDTAEALLDACAAEQKVDVPAEHAPDDLLKERPAVRHDGSLRFYPDDPDAVLDRLGASTRYSVSPVTLEDAFLHLSGNV